MSCVACDASVPALTDGDPNERSAQSLASEREKVLTQFVRLHPMCSLQSMQTETLQKIIGSEYVETAQCAELECVTKDYEDNFFSRPKTERGERACVLEDDCLTRVIARLRFGPESDVGFTCKEFLLPSQRAQWEAGAGLPLHRGKCLVCLRYFTTYLYILARQNASVDVEETFDTTRVASTSKAKVTDVSKRGDTKRARRAAPDDSSPSTSKDDNDDASKLMFSHIFGQALPTHCNPVDVEGGYCREAMLYVDQDFSNSRSMRNARIGSLMFKPFVRFDSRHYRYVKDANSNEWHIVQHNNSAYNERLNGLPPSPPVGQMAA